MKHLLLALALFGGTHFLQAQVSGAFSLGLPPDAHSGGLGETGAATAADASAQHWNAAKLPFAQKDLALSFSYCPLFRNLLPNVNLTYISGYAKIREQEAIGVSLRYFTAGQYTTGNTQFRPNEFAIDAAYARKLGDNFSAALTGRYIRSALGSISGYSDAQAFAVDAGACYNKPILYHEKPATIAFGACVSNIGSKLIYNPSLNIALPSKLRVGACGGIDASDENHFALSLDANMPLTDYHSFAAQPKETTIGTGLEYTYIKIFMVRGGFLLDPSRTDLESHYTLGAGVRYNVLSLDFAYLIAATNYHSALDNSLRFTLNIDFSRPRTPDERD